MAKQRKMTPERRAFINSLLEHYKPEDVHDMQKMRKDLSAEIGPVINAVSGNKLM